MSTVPRKRVTKTVNPLTGEPLRCDHCGGPVLFVVGFTCLHDHSSNYRFFPDHGQVDHDATVTDELHSALWAAFPEGTE